MECPACGNTIPEQRGPDGGVSFACPACGWGQGAGALEIPDASPKPSATLLTVHWIAAPIIFFGPYLALRFGLPGALDVDIAAIGEASDRFTALLDIHYWWVAAVYVVLAGLITPTWDPDDVGWLGGVMDNPFSLSDDYNRTMRTFAFLLLPGKVVWNAFYLTYRALVS